MNVLGKDQQMYDYYFIHTNPSCDLEDFGAACIFIMGKSYYGHG